MEIQPWRWGLHAVAHMEICKHTSAHSINPPAVHGPPAKRALCLLIIYTAHIIPLPISLQWIRHSIFKMQKAKQQKHTHTHAHFVAAPSLTPSSWLWRENGGPLRSEWLRLRYPVKAVVLVTERFIETYIFTQDCVHKLTCTQDMFPCAFGSSRRAKTGCSRILPLCQSYWCKKAKFQEPGCFSVLPRIPPLVHLGCWLPRRRDLTEWEKEREREEKRLDCTLTMLYRFDD